MNKVEYIITLSYLLLDKVFRKEGNKSNIFALVIENKQKTKRV